MKKYFLRFLLTFSIMCQILIGNSLTKFSANEILNENISDVILKEPFLGLINNKNERIIRKMVFGNGIEYVVEVTFSPESTLSSECGTSIYRKSVNVKGTYFMSKSKKPIKELSSHKFKVIFTYDKKTFCEISNAKEDIICKSRRSPDKKWKIKQNNEILSSKDDSICTVSLITNLYKNPKFSTKSVYYENFHMDFMCSKNGNIILNSNVF